MKTTATYIPHFDFKSKEEWSTLSNNTISAVNWSEYPYQPEVCFKLAHDGKMLFIHYDVAEDFPIRTVNKQDQDPVYQDSCVECFILDKENQYHNFEFNANGVALSAKGKEREGRTSRNRVEMQQIERHPSGITKRGNKYYWALTIGIPFASVGLARGLSYRANFYKCGDLTQKKHYLSWNNINTQNPDFHTPTHFGEIVIE